MSFAYPAVLFDLDGTLVDSASDIAEAVNRLFDELWAPRVAPATVRGWIGEGTLHLLATALAHAGQAAPAPVLIDRFMVHYEACLLREARLYPGVAATLAALRARGVRLGVCTNKPERFVRPLLAALGVSDAIEACVGGDSLPERKPSPLPLRHLAARLGHAPGACLMVGDSRTDCLAAQAAGMPVVLVAYGYSRDFDLHRAGALAVLDRFDALLALGAAPAARNAGASASS